LRSISVQSPRGKLSDIHKHWEAPVVHYVGLDVSLRETAICVVDGAGAIIREGEAETEPEAISAWLYSVDVSFEHVGLEAGPLSPWLCDKLRAAGLPAVCIETRRMKGATAAMAVKTDRNDARAIAQAMRVGWFTAVHVKTRESQELRLLLTNRKTLLTSRIVLDNEVRGTLKAFGLKVGPISAGKFEARVLELTAEHPTLQAMVKPMLAAREALQRQYDKLHEMVLKAVKSHPACQRLLTVPGVGPVTALAFATSIDDPARFPHSRNVGAHLGLTPRKYASGETDRNGAISKCGDRLAREALFQAAHALLTRVTRWSALKAWGMAVARRRGLRRATVAVARKLAVIMHRMWADGEAFRWTRGDAQLAVVAG
jgi:transposase